MHSDFPELPDCLNRVLNGIVTPDLPKVRKSRTRKPRGEVLRLYLLRKRGFADGFHRAEFVKRDKRVTVRIGSRITTVPCEQWDRALAKWHGREYVAPGA